MNPEDHHDPYGAEALARKLLGKEPKFEITDEYLDRVREIFRDGAESPGSSVVIPFPLTPRVQEAARNALPVRLAAKTPESNRYPVLKAAPGWRPQEGEAGFEPLGMARLVSEPVETEAGCYAAWTLPQAGEVVGEGQILLLDLAGGTAVGRAVVTPGEAGSWRIELEEGRFELLRELAAERHVLVVVS